MLKPSEASSLIAGRMRGLSSSRTETNTVPARGRLVPPPIWLLAKAISNEPSMPITSPVDFISGPSTVSTPGKRAKGNTASFTARCLGCAGLRPKDCRLSPAMMRAAILATAKPITLATNGTVREARGLTSST